MTFKSRTRESRVPIYNNVWFFSVDKMVNAHASHDIYFIIIYVFTFTHRMIYIIWVYLFYYYFLPVWNVGRYISFIHFIIYYYYYYHHRYYYSDARESRRRPVFKTYLSYNIISILYDCDDFGLITRANNWYTQRDVVIVECAQKNIAIIL